MSSELNSVPGYSFTKFPWRRGRTDGSRAESKDMESWERNQPLTLRGSMRLTSLSIDGRDQSGIIKGGDAPNRVRGECIGETLTLYANGQKLLAVDDDDLLSGDVGLLAGTRLSGGIEVLFTYFAILEP